MAAEHPLRQDAPRPACARCCGPWRPGAHGFRRRPSRPCRSRRGASLGLTDLLSLPAPAGAAGQLLTLWRGFEPPAHWRTVLGLLERSDAGWRERGRWDLLAAGLPPDNWEAITPGPGLADGRPSYLLLSDDNFNPLQENRLALIAPRLSEACASTSLQGGEGQGRRGTGPPAVRHVFQHRPEQRQRLPHRRPCRRADSAAAPETRETPPRSAGGSRPGSPPSAAGEPAAAEDPAAPVSPRPCTCPGA